MAMGQQACKWKMKGTRGWTTSCNNEVGTDQMAYYFVLDRVVYCPFCGKPIEDEMGGRKDGN